MSKPNTLRQTAKKPGFVPDPQATPFKMENSAHEPEKTKAVTASHTAPTEWHLVYMLYEARVKLPRLTVRADMILINSHVDKNVWARFEKKGLQPLVLEQEGTQALNFAVALGKSLRYQVPQAVRKVWSISERQRGDKEFEALMKRVLVAIVKSDGYVDAVKDLNAHNAAKLGQENANQADYAFPEYHINHMFPQQICLVVHIFNQWVASKMNIRVALAVQEVTEEVESGDTSSVAGLSQIPTALLEEIEYVKQKMEGLDLITVHTASTFSRKEALTVFVQCKRFAEYHPYVNIDTENSDPAPAYNVYLLRIQGEESD